MGAMPSKLGLTTIVLVAIVATVLFLSSCSGSPANAKSASSASRPVSLQSIDQSVSAIAAQVSNLSVADKAIQADLMAIKKQLADISSRIK